MGGDRSYPPYEFLGSDGKPYGYNVDLTRAIARVMGLNVEIRLGAWAELHRDLRSGKIDVLEGMSYSDERALVADFSPPHTIVHHSLFARKGGGKPPTLAELKGKEVVVLDDGIMQEFLRSHQVGARIVTAPTHADVLRMLASGKCDYALMAKLPGLYLIRELGLANLEAVGDPVSAQNYCFAVVKGNAALLARFNEGMAILKNTGEYQRIYNRWLGPLEPPGLTWREAFHYGAAVVGPLVLIMGAVLLWSRTLQRQVAARTAELTREVAERRHAEEELRDRQQQLVQADKMAALGVLVSGVAHEINNPTGLILLDLPVLKRAHRDTAAILEERYRETGDFLLGGVPYSEMREEIPRMLDEMLEGAQRIKRIVSDLKDFARRDDAGGQVPTDVNEVVRTALRLVEPTLRKATNRCRVDLAEDLPPIWGNAQRIEQVVVNLVLNACQALPDPERGISVSTRYNRTTGNAVLVVRDEGIGITPEHLSRLTDPFFTTKRESGGTGLGLSVSAGIVKEHGGRLDFDSTPGSGTTVTLALPTIGKE